MMTTEEKKNPDQTQKIKSGRGKKAKSGRKPKAEHVGTQTVKSRFKGSRTFYEFEIIIGKSKGPLNVHRIQIGRKPGENDTQWAIQSLGENKIKNIVIDILKKERILRPLEVPTFSAQVFS